MNLRDRIKLNILLGKLYSKPRNDDMIVGARLLDDYSYHDLIDSLESATEQDLKDIANNYLIGYHYSNYAKVVVGSNLSQEELDNIYHTFSQVKNETHFKGFTIEELKDDTQFLSSVIVDLRKENGERWLDTIIDSNAKNNVVNDSAFFTVIHNDTSILNVFKKKKAKYLYTYQGDNGNYFTIGQKSDTLYKDSGVEFTPQAFQYKFSTLMELEESSYFEKKAIINMQKQTGDSFKSDIGNDNFDWLKNKVQGQENVQDKMIKPTQIKSGELVNLLASGLLSGKVIADSDTHYINSGVENIERSIVEQEIDSKGVVNFVERRIQYSESFLNVLLNDGNKTYIKQLKGGIKDDAVY